MFKKFSLILAVCFMMTACVPSLHPLYTDDDIVFESQLLGKWVEEGGQDGHEFVSDDSTTYTMIYTEDATPSSFEAHLIRLGEYLFLDISPEEPEFGNDFYKGYLIPAHSFYKVILKDDLLRLDGLSIDWLQEEIEKGEIEIRHEMLDGESLLLTASTKDLQELVVTYADNEDAFPEGDDTHRKK